MGNIYRLWVMINECLYPEGKLKNAAAAELCDATEVAASL